jgi:hypothetical protein
MGTKVSKEELIATAIRLRDQSAIEEALGLDAARLIPEAIRLVELRARVPRYQRDVLRELARRDDTSIDAILTRELEDVASAHAEELAPVLLDLAAALAWPGRDCLKRRPNCFARSAFGCGDASRCSLMQSRDPALPNRWLRHRSPKRFA